MNSSTSDQNSNDSPHIAGFASAIGFSTAIAAFLLMITLTFYFCNRNNNNNNNNNYNNNNPPSSINTTTTDEESVVAAMERGLDEETLNGYPKLLYSQAKEAAAAVSTSCSICLSEYEGSDMLRLLPDCGHVFHVKCVDSWLRLHPTCPICRNSPVPTPVSTPLAEVTPLAVSRV